MDEPSIQLVTRWQAGDQQAANELFRRYAGQLVTLARSRLSAKLSGRLDADDLVQSAYRSFFVGVREDRFDIQHGGDVWRLLVAIMLHKLHYQVRWHTARKRTVDGEQHFDSEDSLLSLGATVLARGPSVIEALALVDELELLMGGLEPLERRIVELRLQGYNLYDIAAITRRSFPTVRRVLERVKAGLRQMFGDR